MVRGYTPHSGRLPDFTGRRRILPREAPPIPAPPWPLGDQPTPREVALWTEAWCNPVSILWREEGLASKAALYARKVAEAEKPGSSASLLNALRGLADDLYLSVAAQRRAGIVIADEDGDTPATAVPPSPSRRASPRAASLPDPMDGLSALRKVKRFADRGLRMAKGNPLYDAAVRELDALGLSGMTPDTAIADGLV